ncbi:hypothetical protein [Myroides indicus]|uniref:Uncharacterized protein n=1 Tax=Myroides indicus TaxID=1323422 RepID=A0A4R7EWA3_9FLAO|nr:hypothetical protein [Myroides indicus]TDS55234.1 hypothetical protein C8P70_1235 [Myroides indicus]
MKYIKFKEVISNRKKKPLSTFKKIFIGAITSIFPKANPDFDDKIDSVSIWLLEFENEEDFPNREIGIDSNNNVILKMPYKENYGYWTDNNLKFKDFIKLFNVEVINESEFLKKWNELR